MASTVDASNGIPFPDLLVFKSADGPVSNWRAPSRVPMMYDGMMMIFMAWELEFHTM